MLHGAYAGLEIAVILVIASLFSRQIAIGNAVPTSALESMGAEQQFRFRYCSNLQTVSEKKYCQGPKKSNRGTNFQCIAPITREGQKTAFPHRDQCLTGTSILCIYVRSPRAESTGIARPPYSVIQQLKLEKFNRPTFFWGD